MNTKYTPGPWTATCRSISYSGGEWPEDEFLQWEVDGPRVPFGRGQFFQADARLIAAAPELLEALNLMRDAFLDTEGAHGDLERAATEAADRAIAKATGEQQ